MIDIGYSFNQKELGKRIRDERLKNKLTIEKEHKMSHSIWYNFQLVLLCLNAFIVQVFLGVTANFSYQLDCI